MTLKEFIEALNSDPHALWDLDAEVIRVLDRVIEDKREEYLKRERDYRKFHYGEE